MKINFTSGAWENAPLNYAYSRRFPETPRFIQQTEWIENAENPQASCQGFDFVTLMTEETFGAGTTVTTRCAFFEDAAPLLVFAEHLERDEAGALRYGDYFEVVLYKNGVNVWRLWPGEDGSITWHRRLGVEFPVTEGEIHTLAVTLGERELAISVDGGSRYILRLEDFFPSCHVGINACEGICRFYDLAVE